MLRKLYAIMCMTFLVGFMVSVAMPLQAKVPTHEAERLKTDLTPFGAERAGNAEGTIPQWEGGLTTIPENVKYDPKTTPIRPDPFADDKVLFTITAQNMEQYADKLSEGQKAFFKNHPDSFKMNVYPTRRTAAAPQWVYDNTYKNALNGELTEDGLGVKGAFGGIPFPIPTRGEEAIFNHANAYQGGDTTNLSSSLLVYGDGSKSEGGGGQYIYNRVFYDRNKTLDTFGGYNLDFVVVYEQPARRKGEFILTKYPLNYSETGNQATWQYMPGQRRVRRAPNLAYDTPNPSYGGIANYDDAFMFNGGIDRFNWELKGKKEMFVIYNAYQFDLADVEDLLTPHHFNPKYVRWELHRVWVVEATLKEGVRHNYGKRVMYLDEDTWIILWTDSYDTRGNLWRNAVCTVKSFYDVPAIKQRAVMYFSSEKDIYCVNQVINGAVTPAVREMNLEDDFFTPQNIRKLGRR
ncbi:MAG: DUF1329 domain-containing protein [Desulfobacterales bacterium]|nr:DUF1329 domain-containing protein [Desulfobacterales bacterium]